MTDPISPDVRLLLRDHVTSFEALEILLRMRGDLERAWSGAELAAIIGGNVELALVAVYSLSRSQLVTCDLSRQEPLFAYRPHSEQMRRNVDELARTFEEHHAAVIGMLNAYAIERVRLGALRTFSDAFLIKKKDDDDA